MGATGLVDASQLKGTTLTNANLLGTGITQAEITAWNSTAPAADLIQGSGISLNP